jgi:hypothetical protein
MMDARRDEARARPARRGRGLHAGDLPTRSPPRFEAAAASVAEGTAAARLGLS